MNMNTQRIKPVVVNEDLAPQRVLNLFGIPLEGLLDVARTMQSARNSCTENDVSGAPGLKAWMEGSRRLREIATPLGWNRNSDDHLPTIYHPGRRLKISVMNTDANTGIEFELPQSRSRKGPMTEKVTSNNRPEQINLLGILEEALRQSVSADKERDKIAFWYLCVFCHDDLLRVELSCPSSFDNGLFTGFHERIILIGSDGLPGIPITADDYDNGPDFEITVTRKAG